MSGPEQPPPTSDDLPPDLRSLLDAERDRPMPDEARTRLRASLDAATGGALSNPRGGGGGGGGGGGQPTGGTAAAKAGASATRRLLFGLSTFALGAVAGAIGHSLLVDGPTAAALQRAESERDALKLAAALPAPPPPAPVAPPAAAPAPAPTPVAVVALAPALSAPPSGSPTAPSPPATSAPSLTRAGNVRDSDLAAERAMLEMARTAIGRGDGTATIEVLSRHARQFPGGRMEEERESLWVQALVQAGRYGDARDRGARFRKRFPGSLLLPAVDAALAAIP